MTSTETVERSGKDISIEDFPIWFSFSGPDIILVDDEVFKGLIGIGEKVIKIIGFKEKEEIMESHYISVEGILTAGGVYISSQCRRTCSVITTCPKNYLRSFFKTEEIISCHLGWDITRLWRKQG